MNNIWNEDKNGDENGDIDEMRWDLILVKMKERKKYQISNLKQTRTFAKDIIDPPSFIISSI